jgi:hypothetical protein
MRQLLLISATGSPTGVKRMSAKKAAGGEQSPAAAAGAA